MPFCKRYKVQSTKYGFWFIQHFKTGCSQKISNVQRRLENEEEGKSIMYQVPSTKYGLEFLSHLATCYWFNIECRTPIEEWRRNTSNYPNAPTWYFVLRTWYSHFVLRTKPLYLLTKWNQTQQLLLFLCQHRYSTWCIISIIPFDRKIHTPTPVPLMIEIRPVTTPSFN
jgi:hypothetical protein